MLVSKAWLNLFHCNFEKYTQDYPQKTFVLLHDYLKFSEHDSGVPKGRAKYMVKARKFLSGFGKSITQIDRHETSYKTCEIVAKYCPNLCSFRFYSLVQNEEKMVSIIGLITSLKHLSQLTIDTPITKTKDRCYFPPKSSFLLHLHTISLLKNLQITFELTSIEHLNALTQLTQLEKLTLKISECSGLILSDSLANLVNQLPNLSKFAVTLLDSHPKLSQSCLDRIVASNISCLILSTNFLGSNRILWLLDYFPLNYKRKAEDVVLAFTNAGHSVREESSAIHIFQRKLV